MVLASSLVMQQGELVLLASRPSSQTEKVTRSGSGTGDDQLVSVVMCTRKRQLDKDRQVHGIN
jgi:hypothetical protein